MRQDFVASRDVPDFHVVSEERYCLGWWRNAFPEFDPNNLATAMSKVKSEASLILSQYERMKIEGFAPGVSSGGERKSQIVLDSHS